jgi:thiosulfate dehydrogenase
MENKPIFDNPSGANQASVLIKVIQSLTWIIVILIITILGLILYPKDIWPGMPNFNKNEKVEDANFVVSETKIRSLPPNTWQAPDFAKISENKDLIEYGKELIANTSKYLGPKGSVARLTNGMNCQNCHLNAGTTPFGNNYSAVWSTYPKFRERSGAIESIEKRVNDCMERSLNGKPLKEDSKEMIAIKAYIQWLGTDVKKGETPIGAGIVTLKSLSRPADPIKGEVIFKEKCQSCHGANGEGQLKEDKITYQYPPLWGKHSYNIGAGLYRLSRFAGYVRFNMPLGASYTNPLLSEEEAWDIAAFVNSQDRPAKDLSKDWPNISGKPFDHPFGPFADNFDEKHHKYGPFDPIIEAKNKLKEEKDNNGKKAKI